MALTFCRRSVSGDAPELWNIDYPEHRESASLHDAGDIVLTNSRAPAIVWYQAHTRVTETT
jgi:hypothetical protein